MIYYTKTKRTLNIQGEKKQMYMAKIFRSADVNMDTIAREISHSTTISYPDIVAALKALEMHVSNHVSEGSAVKFGTLGAFIPAIRVKAVEKVDDVTAETVKVVTCRFYPSVALRKDLRKTPVVLKNLANA